MTEQMIKHVQKLIEKAAEASSPEAAMKLSQAALNAANALCSLREAGRER